MLKFSRIGVGNSKCDCPAGLGSTSRLTREIYMEFKTVYHFSINYPKLLIIAPKTLFPKFRPSFAQPPAQPHRRNLHRQSASVVGLHRHAAQRRRPQRRLELGAGR